MSNAGITIFLVQSVLMAFKLASEFVSWHPLKSARLVAVWV